MEAIQIYRFHRFHYSCIWGNKVVEAEAEAEAASFKKLEAEAEALFAEAKAEAEVIKNSLLPHHCLLVG